MIQLTTPYAPGSLDPGQTYTHAKVRGYRVDRAGQFIELDTILGYLTAGLFTEGNCPLGRFTVRDLQRPAPGDALNHTNFSDLVGADGVTGTDALATFEGAADQYLIDQGIYPGALA